MWKARPSGWRRSTRVSVIERAGGSSSVGVVSPGADRGRCPHHHDMSARRADGADIGRRAGLSWAIPMWAAGRRHRWTSWERARTRVVSVPGDRALVRRPGGSIACVLVGCRHPAAVGRPCRHTTGHASHGRAFRPTRRRWRLAHVEAGVLTPDARSHRHHDRRTRRTNREKPVRRAVRTRTGTYGRMRVGGMPPRAATPPSSGRHRPSIRTTSIVPSVRAQRHRGHPVFAGSPAPGRGHDVTRRVAGAAAGRTVHRERRSAATGTR